MDNYILRGSDSSELLLLSNHCLSDDYDGGPHRHHELEISCIKEGHGKYFVDDKCFDIMPYDVFIFNNIETHHIVVDKGSQVINMVIHFAPEFIWNNLSGGIDYGFLKMFFERKSNFENRLDRNNPSTKKIYNLLIDIEREFISQTDAHDLMIKIKLQSIFVEILRRFDYVAKTSGENIANQKDINSMRKVFKYIQMHLADDIKLKDLANVALMSPSYFSASFKSFNGITPFEYVNHMRIAQAIDYIHSTNKSMTEIATLCGFNNSTNFIKNFKKVTGQTPTFYKGNK